MHGPSLRRMLVAVCWPLVACGTHVSEPERVAWCLCLTSVVVTPSTASLEVGDSLRLAATVSADTGASRHDVVWSSSDTSKATVDATGLVVARRRGIVVLTAASRRSPAIIGTATVVIDPLPPGFQGIYVDRPVATVASGDSTRIVATIVGYAGVQWAIAWSSSDTSVARVGETGVVSGRQPGRAVIVVRAHGTNPEANGTQIADSAVVTVVRP